MIKKLAGLFSLIAAFALPQAVWAHATPVSYEPEASTTVAKTPTSIIIHFSERVEPKASDITVIAPNGSEVDAGVLSVEAQDARALMVGMRDAGQGIYTVSWEVVSADDGHFTKGAYEFSVGAATSTALTTLGQIQIQHLTSIPDALTMTVEMLGEALLLGALACLVIKRRLRVKTGEEELSAAFEKRFRWTVGLGLGLTIVGIVAFCILNTLDLQQLRSTDFFTTFATFSSTVSGQFTLYRLALAVLFLVVYLVERRKMLRRANSLPSILVCASFIFLLFLVRSRVSHAAATTFYPSIAVLVHTIHLFFKESWTGIVLAASILLFPLVWKQKDASLVAKVATDISRCITVALGIAGVTGAYIVWLDLKQPTNLFTTEWGTLMLLLTCIAGAMFVVRLFQMFIVDRSCVRLSRGEASVLDERVASLQRIAFILESLLGVALVFMTAYIMITTPPYSADQYSFIRQTQSQGANIALTVQPYESNEMLVTVTNRSDGSADALTSLNVTLTDQSGRIAPIAVPAVQRFVGGYVFPRSVFSQPGAWGISVVGQRPNAYDAVASFTLNYPQDVDASRTNPDERHLDGFTWSMIVIGLLLLLLGYVLYRASTRERLRAMSVVLPTSFPRRRESMSKKTSTWIPVFTGMTSAVIVLTIWFIYQNFLVTDFQKRCVNDGNFWLQSVPMRNGESLSSDTVTGCTLNIGVNHFADSREYQYFQRPAQSIADLNFAPTSPVAGEPVSLSLALFNSDNGRKTGPINDLTIEHDRLIHLLIVGADLQTFGHIHTEDVGPVTPQELASGVFPFAYTFPKAGKYLVAANYYVRSHQFVQRFYVTVTGVPSMSAATDDFATKKTFDGYDVQFSAPTDIVAGQVVKLGYLIDKSGSPVTDLEPYLSAAMHVGIVSSDLQTFIHTHGQVFLPGSAALQQLFASYVTYHNHFVPDKFGPKIQLNVAFPFPGTWTLFGEFKHQGKIVVTRFKVKVK